MKLTTREISELFLEGVITLCIVFVLYLGALVLLNQFLDAPGYFVDGSRSIRQAWNVESSEIQLYKNIFSISSIIFAIGFTYWRLIRRYHQMQLSHVLEELHLIAQGDYDRRIPFQLAGDMGKVVTSINRLVDSTVSAMEDERMIEKSKDELITNVSHDIRTPLTSIIGYLGLVINGKPKTPEETKRYTEIAYHKAQQMKALVDDLFEYTTTSPNGAPLRLNDIPVANFLEQVAADFELEAQKRHMTIEVIPPKRKMVLEMDAEKMVRVIHNLLSNAIKYGRENTKITIEVLEQKDIITIAVRNIGEPISKEVLEHLFSRFYRAEGSRSKETGGTGLGLAIADNIVRSHGGRMLAESVGEVISFYICLPNDADE
ncbi:MAG: sensor histidine kinase [Granulicatella sp.]